MSTAAVIDTNTLIYLAKISMTSGGPSLNTLLNPNFQLVVTTTTIAEATAQSSDGKIFPDAAMISDWFNANIASGKIVEVDTPSYPPGQGDPAILSIIPDLSNTYGGVIVATDDGQLQNQITALGISNVQPQTTYQYVFENWLSGGISYKDYLVTSENLADMGLVNPNAIVDFGADAVGTNGTTISVSPDGATITVTSSSGATYNLSPTDDAFPFTRYGLIKGTVRKLGRDAVQAAGRSSPQNGGTVSSAAPPASTASDLSYPAKVTLVRDWIDVDGHRETIQPGMQVSAEIKTGDRRAIDFLLSPVLQTIREAGRER